MNAHALRVRGSRVALVGVWATSTPPCACDAASASCASSRRQQVVVQVDVGNRVLATRDAHGSTYLIAPPGSGKSALLRHLLVPSTAECKALNMVCVLWYGAFVHKYYGSMGLHLIYLSAGLAGAFNVSGLRTTQCAAHIQTYFTPGWSTSPWLPAVLRRATVSTMACPWSQEAV